MSRRKQSNPRHLDSELELASLLENGSTPTDMPAPNAKDAHVCGECRAEFLDLEGFIAHKQTCTKKRIVVMIDAENRPGDNEIRPKSPSIEYDDDDDIRSQPDDLEGGSDENDVNDLDSVDMSEEGYGMGLGVNGEKDLDENDNFEEEEKKDSNNDTEMISQSKYELMSQLPHLFPFLPNTNVTLEPMSETKAAVAQFAENNLMPQDLAMMSATLYSLQQQQLVQLQLIQQLQQQLITGQLQQNQQAVPTTSAETTLTPSDPPSSETQESSAPDSEDKKEEESPSSEEPKKAVSSSSSSSTFTTPALSTPLPSSGLSALSGLSGLSGLSAFSQLQKEAAVSTSPMMPPMPNMNISTPEVRHRGTMLERSQYASDDPFFKHKCRFCHKVFGSDSALQIHVRSHTGERPFKCNICGNRFSTRGNLKVHFERHKAKYPHAKMNPHPQPEHLERPMPMLTPFGVPQMPTVPTSMPLPPGLMSPPVTASLPMSSLGMLMPSPPIPVAPRPPPPKSSDPESKSKDKPHSSPPPASEASSQKSPPEDSSRNVKSSAAPPLPSLTSANSTPSTPSTPSISSSHLMPSLKLPSPSMSNHSANHSAMPSYSLPATPTSFPLPSPLASNMPLGVLASPFGPLPPPPPPPPPPPTTQGDMFRNSILPTKTIEPTEDLERYMECTKSETSKLEQLVKNIEQKITDPNQCVICHRVLSCKSALQMHYRIHTGERPFRCKICSRSFTTKGNLKTHMGVHRSKPPLRMMHQCPVCHKQFTNLLVLQQHIRMHTGEPVHDMNHAALYRHPDWAPKPPEFGKMFDHKPFDLSQPHGEGKELDLSRSGSYCGSEMMDSYGPNSQEDDDFRSENDMNDEELDMEEGMDDPRNDIVEDAEMMDEKDDYDEPSDENVLSEQPQEGERPNSAASRTSPPRETSSPNPSGHPSSSRPESRGTPVITSSFSSPYYNTSLAALEERVKAIDSQMAQASFERFRNSMGLGHSPGLMTKLPSSYPYQNGDRSPVTSPRSPSISEAGSEGSNMRDEQSHGYNPDAPLPFGFPMMGYGDLRSGAEKRNTTCNICFKTFACRSALDIHYRSHTKERPFKCDVCDRSFSTRGNMRQHMLTHKIRDLPSQSFTGNSSDSQSGCTRSEPSSPRGPSPDESTSVAKPESHSKCETPPPTSAPTLSNNNDESHNNNNNNNNKSPQHSTTPVTSQSSMNHNSNSSDSSQFSRRTGPKHQCMTCMKTFSSASALQIHTRTHTGDKPFKCTVCGKAFTTKGNLKVHMGTHMWSNSPSRRGRRMSIEPPFMLSHVKDNPFLAGFHRPPEFYFQYPPFMNGLPPQKMNEISVIQSVNGGMNHQYPPMHQPSMGFNVKAEQKESEREHERERERERHHSDGRGSEKDVDVSRETRDNVSNGGSSPSESKHILSSGELDLSMRSSSSASANSSSLSSPHSKESPNDSSPYSTQAWLWKAGSCHFCNQTFQSQAALEQHIQTQHVPTSHVTGTDSHKALVA